MTSEKKNFLVFVWRSFIKHFVDLASKFGGIPILVITKVYSRWNSVDKNGKYVENMGLWMPEVHIFLQRNGQFHGIDLKEPQNCV